MPQFALAMTIASGRASVMARTETRRSGGADAAIAADRERRVVERGGEIDESGRGDPHHGLAGGVEARRQGEGHADLRRRAGGGAHFLQRRHGLDPDDVGAALLQPLDLLDEDVDRLVLGERPERRQQVAGRPDRAGDDHRPPGGIGDRARVLGGEPGELPRLVLEIVQRQPPPVTAERIGQDDIGAGIDEALVQRADAVGMGLVPQLRRVAGGEAHVEEVGAGGAVGEQRRAGGEEGFE